VPDEGSHQRSATNAFDDAEIRDVAAEVVEAARTALPAGRGVLLEPLDAMLEARRTPAHAMIDAYRESGDIISAIVDY
jgi:hypothetical protein